MSKNGDVESEARREGEGEGGMGGSDAWAKHHIRIGVAGIGRRQEVERLYRKQLVYCTISRA